MYQHPIIPLVLSIILMLFMVKQSLARHKFLKRRLFVAFLLVFISALILVFYHEIVSASSKVNTIINYVLLGIDGLVGLMLLIFSELYSFFKKFIMILF